MVPILHRVVIVPPLVFCQVSLSFRDYQFCFRISVSLLFRWEASFLRVSNLILPSPFLPSCAMVISLSSSSVPLHACILQFSLTLAVRLDIIPRTSICAFGGLYLFCHDWTIYSSWNVRRLRYNNVGLEDSFCQLPFVSFAVSTLRLQACLFAALIDVLICTFRPLLGSS